MNTTELDAELVRGIEEAQARIEAYDERAAIQAESREAEMRGKTTTDFAVEAVQRAERFPYEHEVARAWLRNYEPHTRVFVRIAG